MDGAGNSADGPDAHGHDTAHAPDVVVTDGEATAGGGRRGLLSLVAVTLLAAAIGVGIWQAGGDSVGETADPAEQSESPDDTTVASTTTEPTDATPADSETATSVRPTAGGDLEFSELPIEWTELEIDGIEQLGGLRHVIDDVAYVVQGDQVLRSTNLTEWTPISIDLSMLDGPSWIQDFDAAGDTIVLSVQTYTGAIAEPTHVGLPLLPDDMTEEEFGALPAEEREAILAELFEQDLFEPPIWNPCDVGSNAEEEFAILRTLDGGATWTELDVDLPDAAARPEGRFYPSFVYPMIATSQDVTVVAVQGDHGPQLNVDCVIAEHLGRDSLDIMSMSSGPSGVSLDTADGESFSFAWDDFDLNDAERAAVDLMNGAFDGPPESPMTVIDRDGVRIAPGISAQEVARVGDHFFATSWSANGPGTWRSADGLVWEALPGAQHLNLHSASSDVLTAWSNSGPQVTFDGGDTWEPLGGLDLMNGNIDQLAMLDGRLVGVAFHHGDMPEMQAPDLEATFEQDGFEIVYSLVGATGELTVVITDESGTVVLDESAVAMFDPPPFMRFDETVGDVMAFVDPATDETVVEIDIETFSLALDEAHMAAEPTTGPDSYSEPEMVLALRNDDGSWSYQRLADLLPGGGWVSSFARFGDQLVMVVDPGAAVYEAYEASGEEPPMDAFLPTVLVGTFTD